MQVRAWTAVVLMFGMGGIGFCAYKHVDASAIAAVSAAFMAALAFMGRVLKPGDDSKGDRPTPPGGQNGADL